MYTIILSVLNKKFIRGRVQWQDYVIIILYWIKEYIKKLFLMNADQTKWIQNSDKLNFIVRYFDCYLYNCNIKLI